jgi:hypothetical protein
LKFIFRGLLNLLFLLVGEREKKIDFSASIYGEEYDFYTLELPLRGNE